jgi:hypothetical protein
MQAQDNSQNIQVPDAFSATPPTLSLSPTEVAPVEAPSPTPFTEPESPVKDYYVDALSDSSGVTNFPEVSEPEQVVPQHSEPVPDFPVTAAPTESLGTTVEAPSLDPTNITMDSAFMAPPQTLSETSPVEALPEQNEVTVDPAYTPAVTPTPDFVTNTVNEYTPQPVVEAVAPGSEQLPAGTLEPSVAATVPSFEPQIPQPVETTPVNVAPSYEAEQSVPYQPAPIEQLPVETLPPASTEQSIPALPGSGNIPSAESVFGPSGTEPEVAVPKKSNKNLIIGVVLGFIAIVIISLFVYFGYTMLSGRGQAVTPEEEMFKVAQAISGKMDFQKPVKEEYFQSVDFSKVKAIKTFPENSREKTLLGNPASFSGTLKIDKDDDYSSEFGLSNKDYKYIFINKENTLYESSLDTGDLVKAPAGTIAVPNNFLPIKGRGYLLYNNNLVSLKKSIKETVNGSECQKYAMVLKPEVLKSYLAANFNALKDANYTEFKSDNVLASIWVDSENRLRKFAISGDIELKSDVVEGSVSIQFESNYSYDELEISKES